MNSRLIELIDGLIDWLIELIDWLIKFERQYSRSEQHWFNRSIDWLTDCCSVYYCATSRLSLFSPSRLLFGLLDSGFAVSAIIFLEKLILFLEFEIGSGGRLWVTVKVAWERGSRISIENGAAWTLRCLPTRESGKTETSRGRAGRGGECARCLGQYSPVSGSCKPNWEWEGDAFSPHYLEIAKSINQSINQSINGKIVCSSLRDPWL